MLFCLRGWLVPGLCLPLSTEQVLWGDCVGVQNYFIYVVNMYATCSLVDKRRGWEEQKGLKQRFAIGEWCVVSDFNVVSRVEERKRRIGGETRRRFLNLTTLLLIWISVM